MIRRLVLLVVFSALVFPLTVAAQTAPPASQANLEPGWHIVRPGETLEALAARYLGSSQLWKKLAELNPDLPDPNRIEPGQRLRMLIPERAALPVARIERISRKVEEQPQPNPWNDARAGDLLVERDAVRTYGKSSAVMGFQDGTSLVVTEDSLILLNRTGGRLLGQEVEPSSIEIVEGQADVALPAVRTGSPEALRPEVEIVLGTTRTRSRPALTGTGEARARKAEGGGAKVMVYGGEGEVEAGGAKVQVAQGMGTSIEAQGPPGPPEKLLPAPRLTAPPPGATAVCVNPRFTWEAVPDAASYIVEICRDPGCGELVERAVGLTATDWRAPALPEGDYHWRATARSRSGLDGYPSGTSALAIRSSGLDTTPPAGAVSIGGPSIRVNDKLYVPPTVVLEVTGTDEGTGVARWTPVIDGREASMAAWKGLWPGGEHRAGALIEDACGNRGAVEAPSFVVDADPPVLHWSAAAPPPEQYRTRRGRRLPHGRVDDSRKGLFWVESDPVARLRWDAGWTSAPAGTVHQTLEVASDLPVVFVQMEGARLLAGSSPVALGERGILRLDAADDGSRVVRMTLRTITTAEGPALEVMAENGVGLISRLSWRLAP